jgi:hypothetical protein
VSRSAAREGIGWVPEHGFMNHLDEFWSRLLTESERRHFVSKEQGKGMGGKARKTRKSKCQRGKPNKTKKNKRNRAKKNKSKRGRERETKASQKTQAKRKVRSTSQSQAKRHYEEHCQEK